MHAPNTHTRSDRYIFNSRRRVDRFQEMRRLRRNAEALIAAHPAVTGLGGCDEAEDVCLANGLDLDDFALFDVRIRSRRAILICVPNRHWHDANTMRLFFDAKSGIASLGLSPMLVPQSFVERRPRLDNAFLIQGSLDIDVSPEDRMAILGFLIESGSGTLAELAGLVAGPNPISAVLHLVTLGALDIDLDQPFSPTSVMTIAAPRR